MLAIPPFGASSNIALWRADNKPPLEVVVANCQEKQEKWSFVEYIGLAIFAIIVIPWASNLIPIFVGYKFPVSYTMLFSYLALCWLALLLLGEGVRVFSQKKGKICEMILFLGAGVFSALTVVTAMLR